MFKMYIYSCYTRNNTQADARSSKTKGSAIMCDGHFYLTLAIPLLDKFAYSQDFVRVCSEGETLTLCKTLHLVLMGGDYTLERVHSSREL